MNMQVDGFKPYYKWIIFNIENLEVASTSREVVLNLIING